MYMGKRAVVIGAGMGGLSAAQALVGKFEKVVVLERDELPAVVESRAGVPQGRHPHALLPGGLQALNELFDGFTSTLRDAGAKETDFGVNLVYEFPGQGALPERELGIRLFMCTRALVETAVRRRLAQQKDVVILDGRRVTQIVAAPDGNSVAAVKCEARDGTQETYDADLVIDASSRGELTLDFLRATGRAEPEETTIGVDFVYSTAVVEFAPGSAPDFMALLTMPNAPDSSRMGLILAREDKRIFAALGGRGADAPPVDWQAFVNFAATLTTDTLHKALATAKPQGKVIQFAFPESRRRHFDRLGNWPRGLLPIADSVCRFNPVYGQGMTAAAKQAVLLRELLDSREHDAQPLAGLTEALMSAINPVLDNIWALSAMPDLAYPDSRGVRPDDLEQALQYQVALHRAALVDADIHKLLFEVIGLITPATALHADDVVEKVKRLAAEVEAAKDSVQA